MSDLDSGAMPPSREEMMSAMFANMVMQQANMALMFMGKMPHPETKEHIRDLEMAQLFIDQLEMLEAKTKGNLDKREEGLLRQSLMSVRMAFVEAATEQPAQEEAAPSKEAAPAQPTPSGETQPNTAQPDAAAAEADSRKKFSKKY